MPGWETCQINLPEQKLYVGDHRVDPDHLDENEIHSAVVCAGVTVDEVAMHIHDMLERLQTAPPQSEEVPEAEDGGQGAEFNCAEV